MGVFSVPRPALGGLVLVLGVLFLSSCSLTPANTRVGLDLSGLGRNIMRGLETAVDGASVSSCNLSVTNAAGILVGTFDFSAPQTVSQELGLDAGAEFTLTVNLTIHPVVAGLSDRVWTHTQTFWTPASGSLELSVPVTRLPALGPDTAFMLATTAVNLAARFSVPPATGVNWYSSDTSVATVSAAGIVTGLSEGTAVISAIPDDNGFGSVCTVTVSASVGYTVSFLNPAAPDITPTQAALTQYEVQVNVAETFADYVWYINEVLVTGTPVQTAGTLYTNLNANYFDTGLQTYMPYFMVGRNTITLMVLDDKGTVDTSDDSWYQAEVYVDVATLGGT